MSSPHFDYDIVIAGSGPAGVSTWLHLHKLDSALAARTLVLEKARHPRPKLCGGGVMRAADMVLSRLRVKIDVPSVPIHSAEFRYHGKRFYWRQKNFFRVVRRHEFDAALASAARQRGMALHEQEAVRGFARVGGGVEVETSRGTYRARALVGADGALSAVRAHMHIEEKPRVSRLISILTPLTPAVLTPPALTSAGQRAQPEPADNTAVFEMDGLDAGLQGYVWDFPCREDNVAALDRGIFDSRIYPGRPRADLKTLFRSALQARGAFDPGQVWEGHPERWFHPQAVYAQPHVRLAGDAAGVDAFAGEGISFALQYGEVAAAELVAAFSHSDFGFAGYHDRVMAHDLGKGLAQRYWLAKLIYPGWPQFLLALFFQVMSYLWR
jgi:flavin-dependent dehydrogenase